MKNGSFQLALLLKEYSIISMKSFQVTIVDLQECSDVFNTSRLLNQPDIKEEEEDGLLCAVGTGGACLVIKQRNNVKFKTFASRLRTLVSRHFYPIFSHDLPYSKGVMMF